LKESVYLSFFLNILCFVNNDTYNISVSTGLDFFVSLFGCLFVF